MQQNHKSFGAAAKQDEDLQKRIDSSDQDEDASYEELNDEDLKTHSSKDKKVLVEQQEEDEYSEKYSQEDEGQNMNMKDL